MFGETRDGGKEQRSKGYRRKEAEEGEKKERRKGTDRGGGREKEEVELRERERKAAWCPMAFQFLMLVSGLPAFWIHLSTIFKVLLKRITAP